MTKPSEEDSLFDPDSAFTWPFRLTRLQGIVFGSYSLAISVVGFMLFGDIGLLMALFVVTAWGFLFFSGRPVISAVVSAGVVMFFLVNVPMPCGQRWIRDPITCDHKVKGIGLALHNYLDEHGKLPPAYIADENGKPIHSWRVLILPFLNRSEGRGTYADVYERYRFDEPWNGPNNSQLAKSVDIREFRCPSLATQRGQSNSQATTYFAVVGENTMWPFAASRSLREVPDGSSNTILLIEAEPIANWMEPKDLTYEEAVEYLASDRGVHLRPSDTNFWDASRVFVRKVLFADGSSWRIGVRLRRDLVERSLNISDGGKGNIDLDWAGDRRVQTACRLVFRIEAADH